MRTDWYKNVNPGLDRLTQLLSMAQPSHGYTVAERAPEIVTAPGIYLPATKGEVIPLQSRQEGGAVSPSGMNPVEGQKPTKPSPVDQFIGQFQKLLELMSLFPKQENAPKQETVPLESRQRGGSVYSTLSERIDENPALFTGGDFSTGVPSGDEQVRSRLQSSVFPTTTEGSALTVNPEESNPVALPIIPPEQNLPNVPSPPTVGSYGMKPSAMKVGGVDQLADLLKPRTFRENTASPMFRSDQEAAFKKKEQERMAGLQALIGGLQGSPLISRQAGGTVTPPTEEDELDKLRRQMKVEGRPMTKMGPPTAGDIQAVKNIPTMEDIVNMAPATDATGRTYFEAHPEEKLAADIEERNRPVSDMYNRLIEESRTRAQGFGMMGLTNRAKRELMKQAAENIPVLAEGLEKLSTIGQVPAKGSIFAPHLVPTEGGEYKIIYPSATGLPPGVVPTGVLGKSTVPPTDTSEWNTFSAMGKEKGWNRDKVLSEWNKVQVERTGQRAAATAGAQIGAYTEDAKKIGDAIIAGKQPPIVSGFGMAKIAPQIRSYLADKGYDQLSAEMDYHATKKFVTGLNSTQQIRLRQATKFAHDSLDVIQNLNDQWQAGRFPLLNKANLKLAINGVMGVDAQKIATQLDTQIADLISELGTVYKGGYASTDETLELAARNLKSEWSYEQLGANLDLVRTNLKIRLNSLANIGGVAGLSKDIGKAETPIELPGGKKQKTWKLKDGVWKQE